MSEQAQDTPKANVKVYYKPGQSDQPYMVDDGPTRDAPGVRRRGSKASRVAKAVAAKQVADLKAKGPAEPSSPEPLTQPKGETHALHQQDSVPENVQGKGEVPGQEPAEERRGSEGSGDQPSPEQKPKGEKDAQKDLGPQFSALRKAERRLREERKAFEMKIEQEQQELASLRDLKKIAEKDKYALLDHLGVDINEWAKRQLGKGGEPAEGAAAIHPDILKKLERLDAIERELAETKKEREAQSQSQQYEQAKSNALAEIKTLMQTSPERFGYTLAKGGEDVVFATLEEYFNETGKLLSYEDAATMVEEHFETDAQSYLGVSKFKEHFVSKETGPDKEPQQHSQASVRADDTAQPTLTNAPDRVPSTRLSKKERRKRAAALLSS
jgi:hypothetical protein